MHNFFDSVPRYLYMHIMDGQIIIIITQIAKKNLHCFLAHNFVRKIKLSVRTKPFITQNEDGHEKCMNQNDTI